MTLKMAKIVVLTIVPMSVFASLPVIDFASIAKLEQEMSVLKETYQNQQGQLNSMTGNYGDGNLMNSDSDTKARQWSPNSWDEALRSESGGNDARYQQLLSEYNESHHTVPEQTMENVSSNEQANDYIQTSNENRAASVNSQHVFSDINTKIQEVYALSKQIEMSKNEKSAVDLNNRLVSELAYIQLQMLKMQAVTNLQISQTQANRLSIEGQKANFDKLPPE